MKALRNLVFSSLLAVTLTACAETSVTNPVNPVVSTGTIVAQIISAVRQGCEFQPHVDFVEALVNSAGVPTLGLVTALTEEICDAVRKAKARPGTALTVRGIPLRGNLLRRRT